MRFVRFLLLWLILSVLFSLFNSAFDKYAILLESSNALFFTIGYYFSYHILIKKLLYREKNLAFGLSYFFFIACLSVASIFWTYEVYVLGNKKFFVENYWNETVFLTSNFTLMLLVVSTLLGFRFMRDKIQTQNQLRTIEQEKVNTELNFLKAQINPHFLFNSLNNILFQIDKSNSEARETLLKFSDMLRYQLYECSNDQIEIERELLYLKNYIEIQMLRKTERYECKLSVSDEVRDFTIAPLLLVPFVENAFKYLSNHSSVKNTIHITIDYKNGEFRYDVINDKDSSTTVTISESKGIGLANVKRRLDLLYNDRYKLDIQDLETQYKVSMKIAGI